MVLKNKKNLVLPGLAMVGAIGCQAILGIDETAFQPDTANDAGASDASLTDANADASTGQDAQAGVVLSLSPSRLFVREGESADVTVTLTRNDFTGPVTVSFSADGDAGVTSTGGLDGGPGANGIGIATLTIATGSNTGILHVNAANDAPQGAATLSLAVSAEKAGTWSLPIMVAGAAGTLDKSFGTLGVEADLMSGVANTLAIVPDDSMYVAGVIGNHWLVRHYFADGSADATFNTAIATTLDGVGGAPSRIAVRGTALVVGGSNAGGQFEIRKFSTAGAIDATFATGGTYNLQKGGGGLYNGTVTGLAFSGTGDVLAAGINSDTATAAAYHFHGSAAEDRYLYGSAVVPAGVRLDANGNAVVGGTMNFSDGGANWFAQHLDSTWNDGGSQTSGNPALGIAARNMVVSPTGQIVIAGEGNVSPNGVAASFDALTLAPGILINAPHGGTSDDGFDGVAAQSDGKLVFSGNSGGSMTNCFVRRYQTDGGVDTAFASNGSFLILETNFGPETHFYDVAVDSWNRIVVVGVSNAPNVGFYVTRLWP